MNLIRAVAYNFVMGDEVEKYDNAAIRHFDDAKALKNLNKFDNAGHLVGFAAECAIKHKMSSLGYQTPSLHLPYLLDCARKHLGSRMNYSSMYNLIKSDVLAGWSVNRRYCETGETRLEELETWFAVTARLFAAANIKERK